MAELEKLKLEVQEQASLIAQYLQKIQQLEKKQ